MGKIFTWREVAARRIPMAVSFPAVVDKIKEEMDRSPGVLGAILCGSVLSGTHNLRSDIDCFYVYEPASRHDVIGMAQKVSRFAFQLHVPVDFAPLAADIALTRVSHIGVSFAVHLQYAIEHGGMIRNNPLPLIRINETNPTLDVAVYLRHKLHGLEKRLCKLSAMRDYALCMFLQKVLEAPMHVARKMLFLHQVKMTDDSKRSVLLHYKKISDAEEYRLLAATVAADQAYTFLANSLMSKLK